MKIQIIVLAREIVTNAERLLITDISTIVIVPVRLTK